MSVVGEDSARHSSSPDLSSPPSGSSPPHRNGGHLAGSHTLATDAINGRRKAGASKVAKDPSAPPKPGRRTKKDPDSKIPLTEGDAKAKKPRVQRGYGPRALKKKAEIEAKKAAEEAAAASRGAAMPAPQQPNIDDAFARPPTAPTPPTNHSLWTQPAQSKLGNHEAITSIHTPPPNNYQQPPQSQPQQQQPQPQPQLLNSQPRPSSGQNYDPIRSSTVAPRSASPMNISTPPRPTTSLGATRSPSISSLIDPPDTMRSYHTFQQSLKREHEHRDEVPNEAKRPRLSPPALSTTFSASNTPDTHNGGSINTEGTSTVAAPRNLSNAPSTTTLVNALTASSQKPTPSISKGPSPGTHSPKPVARKEAAPLATTGSGLLTGSIFGAAGGLDESAPEKMAPTVVINVPLTGDHQYVNFARLAEEKYGFDALHPRLAAQKDRLARVAAAGAALEKAQKSGGSGMSADDMSVDLSNDEGDNSNVELSGMPGSKSGEDGDKPARKKRVLREDRYDVDDDFIDDTEQAWEEQAAVSMDGFFVYSGPLVPEGEEPKVERTDPAPPRRARGGGRGSRGGGAGRGGRAASSTASKDTKDTKDTKEEKEVKKRVRRSREQIEKDKKEAEEKKAQKMALLASKPAVEFVPFQNGQLQFQTQQMAT